MHESRRQLTPTEVRDFDNDGYLIIRKFFSDSEIKDIQKWTNEVHDFPRTAESPWMPYEEINANGERVLCRTDNFCNSHKGFDGILRGEKLCDTLRQISGEEMCLFKDKINYKFAGSGGFAPHVDGIAYAPIQKVAYLTVLIAVDACCSDNGGVEMVRSSHKHEIPLGPDNCIEPSWVRSQEWTPCELEVGDILVFGDYIAHRSGPNRSCMSRRTIYATYNCASKGDMHDSHYADLAALWPPTHKLKDDRDYSEGALRYAFHGPMLSVARGKQVDV